jgi:hypothetical protein
MLLKCSFKTWLVLVFSVLMLLLPFSDYLKTCGCKGKYRVKATSKQYHDWSLGWLFSFQCEHSRHHRHSLVLPPSNLRSILHFEHEHLSPFALILCPCWQKTHGVEEWQIPERGSAPSTPGKRPLVMLTLAVVFMLSIVCVLCGQTSNQFPTWFDFISLLMFSSTAGPVGTSIVIRDSNHITYMYDLPCISVWVSDH